MEKKRSKIESNLDDKNTLKRKMVASSNSEYDAEVDVPDIVSSSKKKIGGRKIHFNVPATPLDNVSFHTEVNIQKRKYVCLIDSTTLFCVTFVMNATNFSVLSLSLILEDC